MLLLYVYIKEIYSYHVVIFQIIRNFFQYKINNTAIQHVCFAIQQIYLYVYMDIFSKLLKIECVHSCVMGLNDKILYDFYFQILDIITMKRIEKRFIETTFKFLSELLLIDIQSDKPKTFSIVPAKSSKRTFKIFLLVLSLVSTFQTINSDKLIFDKVQFSNF